MSIQTVWIEFPARDVERAAAFYGGLFDAPYKIVDDGTRRTATLSDDDSNIGISVNQTADFEPGAHGAYVYLHAGDDLAERLARVESLGGTVVVGKTSMGAAGNYATVRDTEGNTFALYSTK